jgi:hypothetical protein
MEKLNSIIQLLTVMFALGFFSSCLAMVFQWFMMPNMILFPWAVLLAKGSRINEVWRHLMRPLGRCRYCNGTWISIYVYKHFFGFNIEVLFIIAATWFWIMIISDYIFTKVDPNEAVEKIYHFEEFKRPTPVIPMLKSYIILGAFYSMIYIGIPLFSDKIIPLIAGK